MLKQLRIQNIILIEKADIYFENGFNVLTGETGSGKSAVINALSLITGDRTDAGMIRFGMDKGVVEAIFDISDLGQISQILESAGIDHEEGQELIIRREITQAGKSRSFVNNQLAQLSLLKKLSVVLLEMVRQHANQKLFSLETHRDILDAFGDLEVAKMAFGKSWLQENQLREELASLVSNEAQRLREIDLHQMESEEIVSANLKNYEDEELFAEYSRLTCTEELREKAQSVYQLLSGERQAIIPQLNKLQHVIERLKEIDPQFTDSLSSFNDAVLELQEVSHTFRNCYAHVEYQPDRISEINERLTLIDRLKKRYGSSVAEIQVYYDTLLVKLKILENCDSEIEQLQVRMQQLSEENQRLAAALTEARKAAAVVFEKAVTAELQQLNMGKAQFYCRCASQTRSRSGDDLIEFYLAPNVGEQAISIRECASGGELARLLLALQTLLAGKEKISTLVFDEFDANIGGETASVIGEKLKIIGTKHQLICITHFPQVAEQAEHHIQISKYEHENRTLSQLKMLMTQEAKEQELYRMAGNR